MDNRHCLTAAWTRSGVGSAIVITQRRAMGNPSRASISSHQRSGNAGRKPGGKLRCNRPRQTIPASMTRMAPAKCQPSLASASRRAYQVTPATYTPMPTAATSTYAGNVRTMSPAPSATVRLAPSRTFRPRQAPINSGPTGVALIPASYSRMQPASNDATHPLRPNGVTAVAVSQPAARPPASSAKPRCRAARKEIRSAGSGRWGRSRRSTSMSKTSFSTMPARYNRAEVASRPTSGGSGASPR